MSWKYKFADETYKPTLEKVENCFPEGKDVQVNHVEMIAPDCARGTARSGHLYGDLKNDQQPDLTYPGSRVSQN